MNAILVTEPEKLVALCQHIDAAGLAAFDFEFIPERTYFPILCLVQVCVEDTAYIVDPLAIDNLHILFQRIADESIRSIFHAGSQDLELVFGLSELLPKNIFDTQIGAGFAGFGYSAGYRRLLYDILDVNINKAESFSDWQSRPLTQAQIDYAVNDVLHLIPLYENVVSRLNELGRLEWAEEECKVYESEDYYKPDRTKEFLRVKGANSLNSRALAVLRELWLWRDQEARRINKPPRFLLSDNVMIEIARKPAESFDDLRAMRGIRHDQPRLYGKSILKAIEAARALSDDECPVFSAGRVPTKGELLAGDFLYVVLKYLANEIGLAPEHISTRDELQLVVRLHKERKLARASDLKLLSGWRFEVAGKHIVELLSGDELNARVTTASDGSIKLLLDTHSIRARAKQSK